jgi:hypothetical protein
MDNQTLIIKRLQIIFSVFGLFVILAIAFLLFRKYYIVSPNNSGPKDIPGLVLYYPFSGNANDASGNGIDGVIQGAVLTADRFTNPNDAYYFDGIDDSITFEATKLPSGSEPRTIAAWIKADSFPLPAPQLPSIGSRATIVGWGHDDILQLSNLEIVNSKLTYHVYNWDVMGSKEIKLNNWYHLVVVNSGQKTTLYINGVGEVYDSRVLNTSTLPGRIGAFPDQTTKGQLFPNGYDMSYFHGIIDEVCIYNQALTEEQVLLLYHARK